MGDSDGEDDATQSTVQILILLQKKSPSPQIPSAFLQFPLLLHGSPVHCFGGVG